MTNGLETESSAEEFILKHPELAEMMANMPNRKEDYTITAQQNIEKAKEHGNAPHNSELDKVLTKKIEWLKEKFGKDNERIEKIVNILTKDYENKKYFKDDEGNERELKDDKGNELKIDLDYLHPLIIANIIEKQLPKEEKMGTLYPADNSEIKYSKKIIEKIKDKNKPPAS